MKRKHEERSVMKTRMSRIAYGKGIWWKDLKGSDEDLRSGAVVVYSNINPYRM